MSDSAAPSSPAPAATPATPTAAPAPAARKPLPGAPNVEGGSPAAKTEAPKPEAPAAPKPPEKRKYKLKVDGAEVEEELGDEEIAVRLQKGRAAEKRMQEAAAIRKQFQELKELAKSDPALVLKELAGLDDPDAWAEQRLAEKWKRDVMPEADRKLADLEARAKAAEDRVKAFETAKSQEAEAKQMAHLEAQTEATFKRAFEVSGLSWTPEHLDLFGKVALEALDYGIDLTPEQMAAEVKGELEKRDTKSTEAAKGKLLSLKGDDLLNAMGEDAVKEVIRASIAKRQAAQAGGGTSSLAPTKSKAPEPVEKPRFRTTADWRKAFGT